MQPEAIIVLLDEELHVPVQVREIPIPVGVDLLAFERVDKTLTTGVV
jgi:hypothetical protein